MTFKQEKLTLLILTENQTKEATLTQWIQKHLSNPTIYSAPDGAFGMVKIKNHTPDLVVLDFNLPKIPGAKLVADLLAQSAFKSTAFLLIGDPPDAEIFMHELVSGQVQLLPLELREDNFVASLFKGLNFSCYGHQDEFALKFLTPGQQLIKEGTKAETAYIVRRGQLSAYHLIDGKKVMLGTIQQGEFVGEMAYLQDQPRTANVEALTECELIEIPVSALQAILYRRPAWAKTLMTTLSRRLQKAGEMVAEAKKS